MTNTYKGLDLIVPEELWKRVITVQEVSTKIIPKKKKCTQAKWWRRLYKQMREEET